MRSILEKALVHLLNEENEQAEAMFHKFMVHKARQIHESLRQGDDATLESFDDINSDEMFSEEDLSGLEDGADEFASDDAAAAGDDLGDMGADVSADMGAEAGADVAGAEGDVADAEADLSADLGDEAGVEGDDQMAELSAKIDELTAMFKAAVEGTDAADDFGGEAEADADADMGADADADADAFGGEVDAEADAGDANMADDMQDDMQDEVKESAEADADESEEDEDENFDDLSESVVSELEKVLVSMTDGKEIGAGKSFTNNTKSPALQKKPNPMTDGKPVASKGGEHTGFERETAPSVKDMKKRKNTKSNAKDGQSSVSKEGDKSALINKTPGAEAQTHSPLAKR